MCASTIGRLMDIAMQLCIRYVLQKKNENEKLNVKGFCKKAQTPTSQKLPITEGQGFPLTSTLARLFHFWPTYMPAATSPLVCILC